MTRTYWIGTLVLLVLGCRDATAPVSGLDSWSASPAALEMVVGETDTLTITLLTDGGELYDLALNPVNIDWAVSSSVLGPWCYTECPPPPFTITRVSPSSGNPVLLEVSAHVPMSDSIRIQVGGYSGCPDPPECTGATWHDRLPPLKVRITIRATSSAARS